MLLAVLVLDLARGDFLERDRQVVLGAGLDHRRRELVEGPLTEVVVVAVDLPGALCSDDDGRVVRVHVLQQLVNPWRNHVPECTAPSTISTRRATAWSRRSLTTRWWNSPAAASSDSATARRRATSSGS